MRVQFINLYWCKKGVPFDIYMQKNTRFLLSANRCKNLFTVCYDKEEVSLGAGF